MQDSEPCSSVTLSRLYLSHTAYNVGIAAAMCARRLLRGGFEYEITSSRHCIVNRVVCCDIGDDKVKGLVRYNWQSLKSLNLGTYNP